MRGFISSITAFALVGLGNPVYATDCQQKVQVIKEGQAAQCSGFLFSPAAESEAYKATQIVELQEKENKILQERLSLYMKQSDALSKELGSKNSTEELYRVGYFLLGAVLTGFIASNVNK